MLPKEMIIGYCIGDYISNDTYEIITAWIDPRYKGMQISIKVNI